VASNVAAPPLTGPGKELHQMIEMELGFRKTEACGCGSMIATMNVWDVAGCREHRQEIVDWLRKAYANVSTAALLKAAARAVTSGLAFKLSVTDPFGSLVGLAIARAEEATVVSDSQ
jgi:hypothetical protein